MADLFISYASEDRRQVSSIVEALEHQGWTVWWDQRIDAGNTFDSEIERAVSDAKCIVVVWSENSLDSEWVRAEATNGLERNILVQVLLQEVRPPLLFRQRQAISLVDWRRRPADASRLSDMLPSIRRILDADASSVLPISKQKAWALAPVVDETSQRVGPAAYEVVRSTLSFFEDVFLYRGANDEDTERLATREGLDGILRLKAREDRDGYALSLSALAADGRETAVTAEGLARDELISAIVGFLIRIAGVLGQDHPIEEQRVRAHVEARSLEVFRVIAEYRDRERHSDWQGVRRAVEPITRDGTATASAICAYALACRYLGQVEAGKNAMKSAVGSLDAESAIEVHRFRGLYHILVSEDMEKAATEYAEVIKLSPMDGTALNNLAICRFHLLDFAGARELSARDRQLYPSQFNKLENAALFAFYAGDLDEALELSARRSPEDTSLVAPLIPALVAALEQDLPRALVLLDDLEPGPWSTAARVDLMAAMDHAETATVIDEAIAADLENGNAELAARKMLIRAERASANDANLSVEQALACSTSAETLVAATLLNIHQRGPLLQDIVSRLKRLVDRRGRAYARMAEAVLLFHEGEVGEAVDRCRAALALMDLWVVRYCLGCLYREAGLVLDMHDQFETCLRRRGEGCFALLDDVPTYRYVHAIRASF